MAGSSRSRPATVESDADKKKRDEEWQRGLAQVMGGDGAAAPPTDKVPEQWVQDVHGSWFQVSGPLPEVGSLSTTISVSGRPQL